MKKTLFIFLVLSVIRVNAVFGQGFDWVAPFFSMHSSWYSDIAIDTNGNLICSGMYWPTMGSNSEGFLLKPNTPSFYIYLNSTYPASIESVELDSLANIYIIATVKGPDFSIGGYSYTNPNPGNPYFCYLIKLDINGITDWTYDLNANHAELALDEGGNAYVTVDNNLIKIDRLGNHVWTIPAQGSIRANINHLVAADYANDVMKRLSTVNGGILQNIPLNDIQDFVLENNGDVIYTGSAGTFKQTNTISVQLSMVPLGNVQLSGNYIWSVADSAQSGTEYVLYRMNTSTGVIDLTDTISDVNGILIRGCKNGKLGIACKAIEYGAHMYDQKPMKMKDRLVNVFFNQTNSGFAFGQYNPLLTTPRLNFSRAFWNNNGTFRGYYFPPNHPLPGIEYFDVHYQLYNGTFNPGNVVAVQLSGGNLPGPIDIGWLSTTDTWGTITCQLPAWITTGTYTIQLRSGSPAYTSIQAAANLFFEANTLGSLSGRVYQDVDGDNLYGPADIPVQGQQISLSSNQQLAITGQDGIYEFNYIPLQPNTVSFIGNGQYAVSGSNSSYNISVTQGMTGGLDFTVLPASLFSNVTVSTWNGWPRCNNQVPFYITITNEGTRVDSGKVTFQFDPLMTFVSSNVSGQLSGTTYTIPYSGLQPGATSTYTLHFNLPGPGNILSLSAIAEAFDGFGTLLSTDTYSQQVNVVCAYDPNDKQVYPAGAGSSGIVSMDTRLQYLIRFQNTGNDTAFTVLIVDTLDADLDHSTLRVIDASHPYEVLRESGGVVKFRFWNIQLPDSGVNQAGSIGHILFSIKGLPNLPDPTVVNNTAHIYFDLNPPITTNTVMSTFSNQTTTNIASPSTTVPGITITPNPVADMARVEWSAAIDFGQLQLLDMQGRVLFTQPVQGSRTQVQTGKLPSGMYVVQITGKGSDALYRSRMMVR